MIEAGIKIDVCQSCKCSFLSGNFCIKFLRYMPTIGDGVYGISSCPIPKDCPNLAIMVLESKNKSCLTGDEDRCGTCPLDICKWRKKTDAHA